MKRNKIRRIVVPVLLAAVVLGLWYFGILPHRMYSDADFHIETYRSAVDRDCDGVDDQTDILQSVLEYLATEPKYRS
ncbi:MAG: DUF1287 domain-containing protein, partial [Oscillospiraceae bacterium]|nr:DUF1287 domain-containing protein [Oscillospiraceae bacterium]